MDPNITNTAGSLKAETIVVKIRPEAETGFQRNIYTAHPLELHPDERNIPGLRLVHSVQSPGLNYFHTYPLEDYYLCLIKDVFDKVVSGLALLFFAPLLFLLAILIKIDSPGPVFYCPIRIGKDGRLFKMYKFRSMRQCDATSGGLRSTLKADSRITKVGAVIRKFSLDELPQLINVFLGNMSIVGPRPHREFLHNQFVDTVQNSILRLHVKPGITGWAQVDGWRGPTQTQEQRVQRIEHDLWYIKNWSFLLDLKIILLTVFSKKAHIDVF